MVKLIGLLLLAVLGEPAWASTELVSDDNKMISRGWNLFVGTSMADKLRTRIDLGARVGIRLVEDASYQTHPVPVVGVRYARIPFAGFGYLVGLTYDFERKLSSVFLKHPDPSINRDVQMIADSNPAISLLSPEISLALGLEPFFLYGGPIYSLPFSSGTGDAYPSGAFGYQFNGGIQLARDLALEMGYRAVNIKTNSQYEFMKLNGLIFRAVYIFQ